MQPAVTECISQLDLFSIGRREITATVDHQPLSTDVGALMLARIDRQLGLSSRIAEALVDPRDPDRATHTYEDLVRQRLLQIACGYEDCNDAAALRLDPIFQLALNRVPGSERSELGSQPTLSRFEVRSSEENAALGRVLSELWVNRQKKRLGEGVLTFDFDFDSTDDPTHGGQQGTMFHGYYDQYMYHPLVAFDQEGYPLVAKLRTGRASDKEGMIDEMLWLAEQVAESFGEEIDLRLRADAGFQDPEAYDLLEEAGISYAIGLNSYAFLKNKIHDQIEEAQKLFDRTGVKKRHYTELMHKAQTWSRPRRIIAMIECDGKGANVRFVVTSLPDSPERIYAYYCQRGQCENYIKELKNAMFADRLSCHAFESNQFRFYLHTFAYLLMFHLREQLEGTELARVQMDTLRLRLIKIAARVRVTARRIWLQVSGSHPSIGRWMDLARQLHPPPA